ncbi:hypothetical protein [Alicyclobacillus ferrooxydans]|uniref:Uncharacterized protein n=1 Tax=Alicyclobacillus ferrooxydans TaxID=471514 RepID=A0A0P9EH86_9BACL|nr:hypothetical protein [Alicyclobacillus ferrooxydans]KPV41961.1 hypothetical protein AN477_19480 [Alicyclobacillus ferrooxydans]
MRLEVQQSIMNKAFRDNKVPFSQEADAFRWSGTTKVTSKNTGRTYQVEVKLTLKTSARLADQMSACLLKPEGVRMEDLLIAGMIDPKLNGSIEMNGLPKDKIEANLGKFIKKLNKPSA